MNKYNVPDHTLAGLQRYIELGVPTGDFLYAVLSNDLKGAFNRADGENIKAMFEIVSFLWNHAPSACWGSPEKVSQWLEMKRPK